MTHTRRFLRAPPPPKGSAVAAWQIDHTTKAITVDGMPFAMVGWFGSGGLHESAGLPTAVVQSVAGIRPGTLTLDELQMMATVRAACCVLCVACCALCVACCVLRVAQPFKAAIHPSQYGQTRRVTLKMTINLRSIEGGRGGLRSVAEELRSIDTHMHIYIYIYSVHLLGRDNIRGTGMH